MSDPVEKAVSSLFSAIIRYDVDEVTRYARLLVARCMTQNLSKDMTRQLLARAIHHAAELRNNEGMVALFTRAGVDLRARADEAPETRHFFDEALRVCDDNPDFTATRRLLEVYGYTKQWTTQAVQDAPHEPVQEAVPIQDALHESVQEAAPIQDALHESVQEAAPIQDALHEPVQEAAPIQDEPIQEVSHEPVQEVFHEATQDASHEMTQEASREMTQEVSCETTQEILSDTESESETVDVIDIDEYDFDSSEESIVIPEPVVVDGRIPEGHEHLYDYMRECKRIRNAARVPPSPEPRHSSPEEISAALRTQETLLDESEAEISAVSSSQETPLDIEEEISAASSPQETFSPFPIMRSRRERKRVEPTTLCVRCDIYHGRDKQCGPLKKRTKHVKRAM